MNSLSTLAWSITIILICTTLISAKPLITSSEEQKLSAKEDAREAALFKILGK